MNVILAVVVWGLVGYIQTIGDTMFEAVAAGQTVSASEVESTKVLQHLDADAIWRATPHSSVFGIIGSKHQRIRMVFTKVEQHSSDASKLSVEGVSSVNGNLGHYTGTLSVDSIVALEAPTLLDQTTPSDTASYMLMGSYQFEEDESQFHSGVFEGSFWTKVCLGNNGTYVLDSRLNFSDGHMNNAFVGTWTIHDESLRMLCNWGDYRVPGCADDFDIGVAELSVAEKYREQGWQTYMNMLLNQDDHAAKVENSRWWE